MLSLVFEVAIEMVRLDVSRLLLWKRMLYFIEIIKSKNNNKCT
jgi:hypothetical protein